MAGSMGRATSAIAVLVLFLALVLSCEARGQGRVGVGGHRRIPGRGGRAGRLGERVFNIMQFGARPGGVADSTQAIMRAWVAACGFNGFARVVIPMGIFKATELQFSGPCRCRAPLIFQVLGTIKADSDLSNYPDKGWISFSSVDGLMITGTGNIDGQGHNVWQYNDCKTNPGCAHLPATLYMSNVRNANVLGIHLVNSMGFHMHITNSYNIRAHSLTITAPKESPNTDGIHISKSQSVKISRSNIGTGDDCISVGQGASNVTISRVTCGPGHGFSVGSLGKLPNEMDVRGVIVRDCTLTGTENGIRIKTWPASGPSRASGMLFSNIIMNNVQNPIIIDQGYGGRSMKQPSRVKISDVIYQNIGGTTASPVAIKLMCSSLAPCDNLHFTNVNLKFIGRGLMTSTCTNARAGYLGVQIPPPCK